MGKRLKTFKIYLASPDALEVIVVSVLGSPVYHHNNSSCRSYGFDKNENYIWDNQNCIYMETFFLYPDETAVQRKKHQESLAKNRKLGWFGCVASLLLLSSGKREKFKV